MLYKKIISALLIFNIINILSLPATAVVESNSQKNNSKQEKLFKHKVKRSKKQNDNYKYAYVNLDFWTNFNDENLNNYINLAIKNNYDLKLATLNVDEYYQNVKLQLSQEMPQITAGYSPAYSKISMSNSANEMPAGWTHAVPVLINYEADIFLKNRDKTKSVKKLYEASQLDERAAYISIASAVGSVYINASALNEIIKNQENIVNLRKQIYEMMLESNKQGLVSTSDTVKANKAYIYGKSELINYKKEQAKLLHQLAVLIGESPDNVNQLKISDFSKLNYNKTIPLEISSDIITNRPDYLKSIKILEKSGIDVRIAKKEFLPTITISGLATFLSAANMDVNGIYALAAAGLMPILTGGRRVANLKLKKVQYDKALENYYKTNLTAIQEINDALVSIKRDDEKLEEHKLQLKLESQDFEFTKQRYDQGIISKLDLIQMQENLITVNQLIINSKTNCYVDYISLYKATGAEL